MSIIVVDFGSQTAHLISRRIKNLGIKAELVEPGGAFEKIRQERPGGVIFSGGPVSVYQSGSPTINKKVFELGIPILGICYGQQLVGQVLDGKVERGEVREFGPTKIERVGRCALFKGLPQTLEVWMSHGDKVVELPKGFGATAKTKNVETAAMSHEEKKIYCIQFHPEVSHTNYGREILVNFVKLCGLKMAGSGEEVDKLVKRLQQEMPAGQAICAVSGGIDSTVAAVLAARAIGKRLIPIYIDSGLMRLGTKDRVEELFERRLGTGVTVVRAKGEFLRQLKGVTNPEKKRKIIGKLYIRLFEREAKKYSGAKYLIQGTIYSDVIESKGSKHADKIKSHHNVGGLPKKMGLAVVEPLREFYKDEVRSLGLKLGLPQKTVFIQPFPGPGQAVRIMGEVTKKRLASQQQADKIILEEMERSSWLPKVFQCFPVMTGAMSTAVKGDARVYAEVLALRCYESADIMTARWSYLPRELLQAISSRIVNEVDGVSRVVYDITTKPPATMEWE